MYRWTPSYCYNCARCCCCGNVSKPPGQDGCGRKWRVIAISLLKMYVRRWHIKSRWGTSVDAHEGSYFIWWGGSGGSGSDGGGGGGDDVLFLLLLLKSRITRGASHHPAYMATARLMSLFIRRDLGTSRSVCRDKKF